MIDSIILNTVQDVNTVLRAALAERRPVLLMINGDLWDDMGIAQMQGAFTYRGTPVVRNMCAPQSTAVIFPVPRVGAAT